MDNCWTLLTLSIITNLTSQCSLRCINGFCYLINQTINESVNSSISQAINRKIGGEQCCCKKGYFGSFCELYSTNYDKSCSQIACKNNGHCLNGTCLCSSGFKGINCEIQVDSDNVELNWSTLNDNCWSNPCFNGATCVSEFSNFNLNFSYNQSTAVKKFSCICPKGYFGVNCNLISKSFQLNHIYITGSNFLSVLLPYLAILLIIFIIKFKITKSNELKNRRDLLLINKLIINRPSIERLI